MSNFQSFFRLVKVYLREKFHPGCLLAPLVKLEQKQIPGETFPSPVWSTEVVRSFTLASRKLRPLPSLLLFRYHRCHQKEKFVYPYDRKIERRTLNEVGLMPSVETFAILILLRTFKTLLGWNFTNYWLVFTYLS